ARASLIFTHQTTRAAFPMSPYVTKINRGAARNTPSTTRCPNKLTTPSFQLPDLIGGLRPLRDPDATDEG
ncbi:hypothetical protein ABZT03_44320, partial [Streptomyces sp. NPDC005574]|uniref:hypothetical protein n=1 Tax=Streptomyces sp. NPDC005574 TaxID=3156891 RepID=UPI0033A64FD0